MLLATLRKKLEQEQRQVEKSLETDDVLATAIKSLLAEKRYAEALEAFERVLLEEPTCAEAWFVKAAALFGLERPRDGLAALRQALRFRKHLKKPDLRDDLYRFLGFAGLFFALEGLLGRSVFVAEEGVLAFLDAVDSARQDNLTPIADELWRFATSNEVSEGAHPLSLQVEAAVEELQLMLQLLAIKDPFEGWKGLTKAVSEVWPNEVGAVRATREERG